MVKSFFVCVTEWNNLILQVRLPYFQAGSVLLTSQNLNTRITFTWYGNNWQKMSS
jgi:hypothetical protein